MDETSSRWIPITHSEFAHEQDALDYLRIRLPDREPYRLWSNFEFITRLGDRHVVYEVDAAVLTPRGFFLVEIKSWSGRIWGGKGRWRSLDPADREHVNDNPLRLIQKKAKLLKSLLERTPAGRQLGGFPPQAVVFLSAPDVVVDLAADARQGLFGLDHADLKDGGGPSPLPSIVELLTNDGPEHGRADQTRSRGPVTATTARRMAEAMEQDGIQPSLRSLRAGDYQVGDLLGDGQGFQEFEGTHLHTREPVRKRVRIYVQGLGASKEAKATAERAAEREFRVLQRLRDHPGVVAVEGFTRHERGPVVVFEHDPDAQRLDDWLACQDDLDVVTRLDILRQLADAVRFAHSRRVAHRALSPHSVQVSDRPMHGSEVPHVKVLSWQASERLGDGTSLTALPSGTRNLGALVDDTMAAYQAPETLTNPAADPIALDVFSLGALAYLIITGQLPADDALTLRQRLETDHGLLLPATFDGATSPLRRLVRRATDLEATNRYDSVEALLDDLDAAQASALAHRDAREAMHAADAHPGDRLGEFVVVRRLGQGATAVVLLVRDQADRERVLKVALDSEADPRIRDESRVLDELTDRRIVRSYTPTLIGGRAAVVLARAGDRNLARVLREDGPARSERLRRWGDDLLAAVAYLEDVGVAHRDIKPENLGVVPFGTSKVPHLVLFDFSLSAAPADDIHVGTPPYLEPFLVNRPDRRWDAAAERYAAAVTLYEMATGITPRWGDGQSDPALLRCEATIATNRLPPRVRPALGAFFTKALRREPNDRFPTAQAMQAAWNHAFTTLGRADTSEPAATTAEHEERVEGSTPARATTPTRNGRSNRVRARLHGVHRLLTKPRRPRLMPKLTLVISAAGMVIVFVGAFTDQIGIGNEGASQFGPKQVAAVIAGTVIVGIGLAAARWRLSTSH